MVHNESRVSYFLEDIFALLILTTGICTNLLVMLVYSRKRFKKLPTKNLWRLLSLVDILCLNPTLLHYLKDHHINIYSLSDLACKLCSFISHFNFMSAWLLVFISIDRLFSIIHQGLSSIVQRRRVQVRLL